MPTGSRLEDIDAYTTMHIRHKVKQLVKQGKFPPHMADDLVQELSLDFLRRRPKYDAARSSRETFTVRIVGNKIASLLRARRARVRDFRRNGCSLDELVDSGEGTPVARHETVDEQAGREGRGHEDLHHLIQDVHTVLDSLPGDLKSLCIQLQSMTVSEIARSTGVPRTTIYELIRKLHEHFKDARLGDYLGRR
jgi:RNA polymerase sigma-70 factor (ECF subfamily)